MKSIRDLGMRFTPAAPPAPFRIVTPTGAVLGAERSTEMDGWVLSTTLEGAADEEMDLLTILPSEIDSLRWLLTLIEQQELRDKQKEKK